MNNGWHSSRELLPHPAIYYTPTSSRPPLPVLGVRDTAIQLPEIYDTRQDLRQPLPTIEPYRLYTTVHPPRLGHPQRYTSPPENVRHYPRRDQPPVPLGPTLAPFLNVPRGSETLPARLAPFLLPRYLPRLAPAGSDPWTAAWPPAPPPPPRERSSSVVTTTDHPQHGPQETTYHHYDEPELPHLTTNEAVPHPAITRYPPADEEDGAPGPRILMIDLSGDDSPEPEPEEQERSGNTGESVERAGEGPSGVSRHDTPGELGLAVATTMLEEDQPGSNVASTVMNQGREGLKRRRDSEEDDGEEREAKRQETGTKT